MAHSVLPGLVIALAIGIDPTFGGLISGLLGALVAERLNQRFKGREESSMNTVLAGIYGSWRASRTTTANPRRSRNHSVWRSTCRK